MSPIFAEGAVETWTREELIEEIHRLQFVLTEVRACEDKRCCLCASCVTKLYVVAKPPPGWIPRKYVEAPWRKR